MQCTKLALYASLVVTLLAAGCVAQQAQSPKPGVAVLDIRGARSAELQDTVREILGEDYRIVDGDDYRDAARELRAKRMKRRHVAKVANELGVEAVIYGKVVKRSRTKYALSLRVRDGKTGKLIKKMRIPVKQRRSLSKKNARKLERTLLAIMEDVAPPPPPADEDDEDVDRDDDEDVAVAKAEPKRKRKRAKRSDDDVELDDDFVLVDRMRADGQVIDDEVPPHLK